MNHITYVVLVTGIYTRKTFILDYTIHKIWETSNELHNLPQV